MQVHVRPNVSDPFPEKIVRERLDGAIRLLRGAIAVISKESSAVYWMRLRDIVSYIMVANRTILGMERHLQASPTLHPPKQSTQSRSAVIQQISKAKPKVAAGMNSPSPQ